MSIYRAYRNLSLAWKMILAFLLGTILGLALWYLQAKKLIGDTQLIIRWIEPLGTLFIGMLKMIVIPIVLVSIVQGAASLPLKKFGRIGGRVILWYLLTSLLAAIVGLAIALLVNPGQSSLELKLIERVQAAAPMVTPPSANLFQLFGDIFQNPFQALSQGNFLSIIAFAILFGLAYRLWLDQNEPQSPLFLNLLREINETLFIIIDWIMAYAPIGILALSCINFATFGIDLIRPYLKILLGVSGAVLLMIFGIYGLLVIIFTRHSPIAFFSHIRSVMVTAFVTRSSAATLPVSLATTIDTLKVRRELAEFSLPLGATVNMDGVCIHLPMFAVLAMNLYHIPLSLSELFLAVITTVLAAIGAGGVPGGSLMLLFIILNSLGLNDQQTAVIVAIALGINPILDMFETMNNVTGDVMCTYVVAYRENLID